MFYCRIFKRTFLGFHKQPSLIQFSYFIIIYCLSLEYISIQDTIIAVRHLSKIINTIPWYQFIVRWWMINRIKLLWEKECTSLMIKHILFCYFLKNMFAMICLLPVLRKLVTLRLAVLEQAQESLSKRTSHLYIEILRQ